MNKIQNHENNILDNEYMSSMIPASETLNVALLGYALDNVNSLDIDATDLNMMKRLMRKCDKITGTYTPIYEQKGATLQGRVFCKTGLCALSRKWRNALAYRHYYDCDMVNAAYSFALQTAQEAGLKHDQLQNYCSNRDEMLLTFISRKKKAGVNITKDDAKMHYIKLLFTSKSKNQFVVKNSLESEIHALQKYIMNSESKLVRAVEHEMKKKNTTYNKGGKVLSHYIFNKENEVLQLAIKYLLKDKWVIGGSMMDGFFVGKQEGLKLDNLNNYLKDVEGVNVRFVFKDMKDFPPHLQKMQLNMSKQEQVDADTERYKEIRDIFENTEDVAKIKLQNGFLVLRPEGNTFVSTSCLRDMYCDWVVADGYKTNVITGSKIPKLFIDNWILDPNKRIYENETWVPDIDECPKRYFNTFKGFSAANLADTLTEEDYSDQDRKDYKLILRFMKNLFIDKKGQEQSAINYVYNLRWLANIIQNPTRKSEIMIVIKGKKGIGKSDYVLMLGRLFGEDYLFETRDPASEVWGSFNDALKNKILVNIDEPEGLDNAKNIEKLKGAITSKVINIKQKYKDMCKDKNFINFIMTLNEENTGIRITDDNRRFALFESATKRYTETEYSRYYNAQRNPNALALFYKFLKDIDLSNFQFDRTTIPKTDFLERSMRNSVKNYHAFLEQLLMDDHTRNYSQVHTKSDGDWIVLCGDLYKGYVRFCETSGDTDYQSKVKNIDFKREMRALDGVRDKHTSHKPQNINGVCYIIRKNELKQNLIELGLTCETTSDEVQFLPETEVSFD